MLTQNLIFLNVGVAFILLLMFIVIIIVVYIQYVLLP